MLSLLKAQGVTHVLEDSSGNGGAAISAYAAAGGMKAKILVPASTSPAKTVAARAAGAEIELVPGSRQVLARALSPPSRPHSLWRERAREANAHACARKAKHDVYRSIDLSTF